MKKIIITIPRIPEKSYPIFIGENILGKINDLINLRQYSKIAIITDKNIEKHWLKKLESKMLIQHISIIVKPGEKEKNIETLKYIWAEMVKAKLDRKSLVINLGGGVIGDIGGFAASTYMRGIDFINIPTTLLAMVDESVGGKTGIDFLDIKNIIGTFNQPMAIFIDVQLLKTLPNREFISGFGEIIKHGLIVDKKYLTLVTLKKPLEFSSNEMVEIVVGSIKIKTEIVKEDEKEEGLRKILNFGHTIGHAIESLSLETNNPLLHGEAINIGMIAETVISELSGLLEKTEAKSIYKILSQNDLPTKVNNIKINDVIEKTYYDKKTTRGTITWTLLKKIGHALINQKITENIVREALQRIII